jgi:electron transport complex protein RnfB
MPENSYKHLANRLDALPNGFPPTEDGSELRLLQKIYSPEEASLASQLRLTLETPVQIAARLKGTSDITDDPKALKLLLKNMARKGLITAGRTDTGLGYGLMPFVVGVYEAQAGRIDTELASLFETYYKQAFGQALSIQPPYHRVVPVNETINVDMEVHPFESASEIVNNSHAWGVLDCICRVQKQLIGDPCDHPVDVCMIFSQTPGVFDHNPIIRALTKQESMDTLHRASQAGLVHSVSNTQEGTSYICNCCTCSCGILRGMAELGIANVVARSAFINQVNEELCIGCETCIDSCQFDALSLEDSLIQISQIRCVGCGACIPSCEEGALILVRRADDELLPIPVTSSDWRMERAIARGQDIEEVL